MRVHLVLLTIAHCCAPPRRSRPSTPSLLLHYDYNPLTPTVLIGGVLQSHDRPELMPHDPM